MIALTSGTWRHSVKLTCDFSFAGAREVDTDAGPAPRAGKTSEYAAAADHVERYAPMRNVTTINLLVERTSPLIGHILSDALNIVSYGNDVKPFHIFAAAFRTKICVSFCAD